MYEWYKKGYIREDIEEVLDAKSYDGKQYGSSLYLDEFGDYGVVLDKIDTEYETVGESLQSYKYISYESSRNAMVIPRTANNHERAMEIINLLNSSQGADLYRLLVNGFAGRHYVKNSSGIVDQIMDKNGNVLYRLSPYTLGNVYNDFEHSQGEFHQLKKYNQEAIKSPLLGFELDTRMIVLEMKTIDLVVDQFIEVLSNGTSDDWEDTYEQFISKIRLAGSQKVIDEMQRQIETFTESQN